MFDPSDIRKWADEAIAGGETGVIQPLIDMSTRGEAIRAEMALRQRLADEAHARWAQACESDDLAPVTAGDARGERDERDVRARASI